MKRETEPIVSVIVPLYKVEDYLRECLDSAVRQTLQDIEIICVDDGSPDASADIAQEYVERFSHVRLIRKENGGLSSARNTGMDAARGRYVYFLDSDDYIEPDCLEKLSRLADAENLDIVYFNTELFFESQKVRELNLNYVNYYTRKHDYPGVCTGQTMFTKMRSNREFLPSVCLQMFRRSMIEENHLRFYNGIIHEDNLFSFQCMVLAQRVAYMSDSFYHRRMHGDSIMTSSKSIRNVEGYLVTYAEILAFMHGRPVEEEAFDMLSEFLYTSIWGNGRRIFRDLEISEEEAHLTKGDFCAAHFLDMIKRSSETEFDRSRLKDENARLRRQIQALQTELASGRAYRKKSLSRKIKGFFRCVKDHGFLYTVKYGFGKVVRALGNFDRRRRTNKLYRLLTWLPRKVFTICRTLKNHGMTYHFRAWSVKRLLMKQTGDPFVSVIMPVYNAAEFLEQGLDTLLNQTMRNIEILAVDDGSTDNSVEILNRYAARDPRVRVLTQQNKFAGAARNLGLEHARGEYLIFLDSDDFFARNLCEDAYFAAKVHRADVALFGAKHYHHTTGQYREIKWLLHDELAPKKQPFNYKDCPNDLYRISTPAPWTKIFRRQFVLDKGLRFQAIQNTNDLFFTYCAMAMAERITTLDKPLVYYRIGLQTNLQTTKKKHPFCFYEAYLAWHDKLAELGVLDAVRRSYVNIALSGCLHNLRSNQNPEVKQMVFEKLKNEAFRALEIPGHDQTYYYSRENYQDMLRVLNGTFEAYMEAQHQE